MRMPRFVGSLRDWSGHEGMAQGITATNRALAGLVDAGQFRQDLLNRLRVVQIALPPLGERSFSDVEGLVEHFLLVCARKHDAPVRGGYLRASGRACASTPGPATCASSSTASRRRLS